MPLIAVGPYPWLQDIVAMVVTFGLALLWLRIANTLAARRIVSQDVSRKLIHIGTGPVFVLCWLLYSGQAQSRWLAALVPAMITLQFLLIGLGVLKDEAAVRAMSRTGNRRELLHGPLQYGVIFVLITLVFWLDSPIGIVALMILCGGDGLADLVGRRFGTVKLPWNPRKSWAGSAGMAIFGFLLAFGYVALFASLGVFSLSLTSAILPILLIALAATVVEAVSGPDIDNITITVTALGVGWLLTDATGLWNVAFL
jgi:phytol kinase